ncbi:YlmC/YmxH family sporulation protein [Effusibacillus dendaii]|uniref:PRC-barrel domain-containing protein n=1 Tax=Effusibacillus dendaii TaxID=2743772 RepID=A0A7I8D5B7_9BACL|nr:YlmC/YmxH family sporulation protein [Effusibacillus dendaii]BCJ85318.1 hypothetical protein skT53_03030 [Effusibacillus dendaii]
MLLSELMDRVLVDMQTGEKIGQLNRADLSIDPQTGKIGDMWLPQEQGILRKGKRETDRRIAWDAIRTVGTDMILLDLGNTGGEGE